MPHRALPPLHLYRHLLREASYLPRLCAPYIRSQITFRFHQHLGDARAPSSPLTTRRLRIANSHLNFLRAANAGVLLKMTRILHLATGRTGRRRRALLAQEFITNKSTNNSNNDIVNPDSTTTTTIIPAPPPPDWLDAWNLPKLRALAASQARQTFWSPRAEMKANQLEPTDRDIPTENAFGRPLGAKAARSKLRKFYKALINRVMPPLPRDEWERLGRLARGEEVDAVWKVPARRTRCRGGGDVGPAGSRKTWDWRAYAVEPVRSVERGQSRSWKARTGEEGEAPFGTGSAIGLHRYERARLWRRLYMRVWQATPMMEEAEGGRGWKVEWGKVLRETQVAMPAQMGFFEGAPEKLPSKKSRGKPQMRILQE